MNNPYRALLIILLSSLTACTSPMGCSLPRFIFSTDDLLSVGPLGKVYPGGSHIFPVHYVYPQLKNDGLSYPPLCGITKRERDTKVFAPGDIRLFEIERQQFYDSTRTTLLRTGYGLRFISKEPGCSTIDFDLSALNTINPAIEDPVLGTWRDCDWHTISAGEMLHCSKYSSVGVIIPDGEVLGHVGGGTGTGCGTADTRGLNFRAYDSSVINSFIVPSHYFPDHSYKTAVCPIELFDPGVFSSPVVYGAGQLQTHTIFESDWGHCGKVSHDQPGTAQGNWFRWGAVLPDQSDDVSRQFALVYDELDPGVPVISVGRHAVAGVTYEPYGFTFPMNTTSGKVNRNFEAVTYDIYCFDHLSLYATAGTPPTGIPARILIRLATADSLYYQEQSVPATGCGTSTGWSFTTDPVYRFMR